MVRSTEMTYSGRQDAERFHLQQAFLVLCLAGATMDRSRWACLSAVFLYVVVFALLPLSENQWDGYSVDERTLGTRFPGAFFLLLGFVCVWWSETLGDALWVGRGAWNPRPSSGGAMKVLGWLFLAAAFAVDIIVRL